MQLIILKTVSTLVATIIAAFIVALTVSTAAFGEPQSSAPYKPPAKADSDVTTSAPASATNVDTKSALPADKSEGISIAPVPQLTPQQSDTLQWSTTFERSTYFYPYKNELVLFIGGVGGTEATSSSTQNAGAGVIGMAYVFPSLSDGTRRNASTAWEGGGEYSTSSREYFWLARRQIFHPQNSFRGYYSYGVMHDLVPSEQLASLSDWDNYAVRLGVGFEDVMTPPRSVQFELVGAAGIKDFLVLATCGMAWGF